MPLVVIAYYSLAILTLASAVLAVVFNPRWYWLAALLSWIVSFLGGFSIGMLTLVLAFIFLALALGHQFGWIKTRLHAVIAVLGGAGAWAASVAFVDDYWFFFPLAWILEQVF
jgi:hypothetical protein